MLISFKDKISFGKGLLNNLLWANLCDKLRDFTDEARKEKQRLSIKWVHHMIFIDWYIFSISVFYVLEGGGGMFLLLPR